MAEVVVIGSGFGGLALALRLQAAGVRTTLFERCPEVGGRAGFFVADGFRFDMGPTVLTDPTAVEELFHLSGASLSDYVGLLPVMPFYRLHWADGRQFDYGGNEAALLQQIAAFNPGDVAGYQRFLAYSRAVFHEGYEKLGARAFLTPGSMLRAAPALLRYRAWRPVYRTVARYLSDPHLRQAFSFHTLLVGGNPFTTSSIYTLIHALEQKWGVWYPRGGMQALVAAMARRFAELGGTLQTGAGVERILTDAGRVTGVALADGRQVTCRAVASNADLVHTYGTLLRDSRRGQQATRRLQRKRFSPSLFVLYFGVRGTWPGVPQHSILFGPRYRGLLDDIYRKGRLASDFSLYVHHPTATDPALAPPGCSTFYALAPVPHLGAMPADWARLGPQLAKEILQCLEARLLPGLQERLVLTRLFTPADFAAKLGAFEGSAFSLEPRLLQSAWFRVHNRDRVLRNLYFVGAGTHPGAGIPGVLASAKATAGLLLADLGRA